jgi:predicted aspartyl protease
MTHFMNCAAGAAIVAGLYLAAAPQARAEMICRAPGDTITVAVEHGAWSVGHNLSTGMFYRERQYTMTPDSNGMRWRGWLSKNRKISMTGEILGNGTTYVETLFNNGKAASQIVASCTDSTVSPVADPPLAPVADSTVYVPSPAPAPAPHAETIDQCVARMDLSSPSDHAVNVESCNYAPQPAATSSGFTAAVYDIPNVIDGLYVNIGIGSQNYHMTLDTGSSDMHISAALADWMVANGQATVTGERPGRQADGSVKVSRSLLVKSVTLEGHTIRDVPASDGAPNEAEGSMLFGLGVLKKFGKFTVDTVAHQLVLG